MIWPNTAVLLDRYPLDDQVLALDALDEHAFGFARLGHDVHSGVVDDVDHRLADQLLGRDPHVFGVGAVELDDPALGVGHQGAVLDVVEDQVGQFQLFGQVFDPGVEFVGGWVGLGQGSSPCICLANATCGCPATI
jgi:hypothetical protein